MHSTVIDAQVWQRWSHARHLKVLAAFEDSSTGTRIKAFRQEFTHHLTQGCRVIEHVWLCNMFRLRELREIAAEEAAASDLIVIALHNAERLPDEVKAWADLWLRQRADHKPLLLALLEPTKEGATRTIEMCLREAAHDGGIELLVDSVAETEGR
jgi:hypothetical protein